MSREIVRTHVPGPAAGDPPGRSGVRVLAFDAAAWGTFDAINPQPAVPQRMDIYTAPPRVTRVIVDSLAVVGDPLGLWYNLTSWNVEINRGGSTQEYQLSSMVNGSPGVGDVGMRWGVMGGLEDGIPVCIELAQDETIGLLFASADLGIVDSTPITVIARVRGRIFYAAV
jgi:hypothetical protein